MGFSDNPKGKKVWMKPGERSTGTPKKNIHERKVTFGVITKRLCIVTE